MHIFFIIRSNPDHVPEKVDGAAATCKDAGYNDAYKCTTCKHYFTDSACKNEIGDADAYAKWKTGDGKINKLDYHPEANMHTQTRVDPDCTTDGCKAYCWCDVCGTYAESYTAAESKATLGTVIGDSTALTAWKADDAKGFLPMIGHDYSDWVDHDELQHKQVCSHDASHVIYADHEWGDWELTRRGDESAEGEYSRTCSDCTAVSHKYFRYTILEGDGGVYTRGQSKSGKTLVFRADGEADLCTGIQVNGKTLDPANYTKTSGSTIITLDAAKYLDKLAKGDYKLTFVYPDGSVSANFTVKVPLISGGSKDDQPGTGYDSHIVLWISLIALSAAACAWALIWLRKRGLLFAPASANEKAISAETPAEDEPKTEE